jgi:hypothetical protein
VFPGHPQSFYGRSELVRRVQRLAIAFRALNPTLKVRFTDMSFPRGGLFDVNQTWEAPHARHHNGRSVDIARELWDTENGCEVWMGTDTSYFELLNMLAERLDLHRILETRQRIHYDLPVRTSASGYDILAPSRVCHPDDAYPGGRR